MDTSTTSFVCCHRHYYCEDVWLCDEQWSVDNWCIRQKVVRLYRRTQIWAQSGSDLPQMGQIRGFFQIRFSTFWRPAPKCTESDLKKIPGFVPFGANLTHFGPKSVHAVLYVCFIHNRSSPFWLGEVLRINSMSFSLSLCLYCFPDYKWRLVHFIGLLWFYGSGFE